ncbi:MAG: HD domain-containing protein [Lachnospiraceae bacterium]
MRRWRKLNYKDVLHNEEVKAFLKKANENLGVLGYTDHSEKHCAIVAKRAGMILSKFEYPEHEIELAEIAGAMHDIGNAINRNNHAEYGAILAYGILEKMKMPLEDRIKISSAIGNHDESTGGAIDVISAALILADKTDVRRNRVRSKDKASFDKHDRVNYAVTNATVKANPQKHLITLDLQIDEDICTMYEYFEIFLGRMMMCRGAAELLGAKFKLTANGSKVL